MEYASLGGLTGLGNSPSIISRLEYVRRQGLELERRIAKPVCRGVLGFQTTLGFSQSTIRPRYITQHGEKYVGQR
ncbi:MAG: hypothetical protein CM1200mP18_15340 [Gammaproteobacteria bacterium]|nr:MAG: hypothetical protein CM1200mP18_15340 [Gammaproteobacteria bacterium]